MGNNAIICLGNRYFAGDDVGWRVYDQLCLARPQSDIDVIDGGLCGLDLLRLMEGRRRVVFADAVAGMADNLGITVLARDQVAAHAVNYGHSAGLPYLLHMLPHACRPPWPEIALVGADGAANEATLRAVAERCVEIAIHGLP
ncbi:MAG: hydrogenase maturation protease [Methylococcaceae bacterium]|nr:MAG: hydrogenase maturation protease [Methylococcaceae bacterium]